MRCKILALFFIAASAVVFTGCDAGQASMAPGETNVLGIFKNVEEDYSPTTPNTFAVSLDELYTRKNFSGDKTTLLWGLVTIKDY